MSSTDAGKAKQSGKSRRGRKPGQMAKSLDQLSTREEQRTAAYFGNYNRQAFAAVQNLDLIAKLSRRKLVPEDVMSDARSMAWGSVADILNAIDRRDSGFFCEIARRLDNLGPMESPFTPADKVRHSIVELMQEKEAHLNPLTQGFKKVFPTPVSVDELQQAVRSDYPHDKFDESTVRQAADDLGIKRRARGRPKKTGN